MGTILTLLFFVACTVIWLFLAFVPDTSNKKALNAYNWSALFITALVTVAFVFNVNVFFGAPNMQRFIPFIGGLGALSIIIVLMAFFFLVRNFWIFLPPRLRGRRF